MIKFLFFKWDVLAKAWQALQDLDPIAPQPPIGKFSASSAPRWQAAISPQVCRLALVLLDFPGSADCKEASAEDVGDTGSITREWLSGEDPMEKGMATHSSIVAWRNPWTEEPGWLQSMGLHWVGHDWSNLAHLVHGVKKQTLYWIKIKRQKDEFITRIASCKTGNSRLWEQWVLSC